MDDWLCVLTVLVPLFPLLAIVIACAGKVVPTAKERLWIIPVAAGFSLLSSLLLVGLLSVSGNSDTERLIICRWMAVSAPISFDAHLDLRADELSLLVLLAVTFSMTCLTAGGGLSERDAGRRWQAAVSAAFALFTISMLLLSSNFLQLLIGWQLGVWAVSGSMGRKHESAEEAALARGIVLVNLTTDVLFISGVCLIWALFGSLDFSDVLDSRSNLEMVLQANSAALTVVCLCLFAGVIGRCAQFPLFGWVENAANAPLLSNALIQSTIAMPAGVYVMVRCTPLFEASPLARQTMAVVGALTALFSAAMAVTSPDLKRLLGHTTTSHFGLMILGLGTGRLDGLTAALFLLIVHVLAKSAFFLLTGSIEEHTQGRTAFHGLGELRRVRTGTYWLYLAAAVVLFSGFWGQNAILAAVWNAAAAPSAAATTFNDFPANARPETDHASGAEDPATGRTHDDSNPPSRFSDGRAAKLLWLLLGIATLSLLLAAFAVFRGFFLVYYHDATPMGVSPGKSGRLSWSTGLSPLFLLIAAGSLGLWASLDGSIFERWPSGILVDTTAAARESPFAPGISLPLVLLAAVWAWMLYLRPSPWPQRLADALGPVYRLCRNGFYLNSIWFLGLILPTRGIAQIGRFVDWLLVDGLLVQLPKHIPAEWARTSRPVQTGMFPFYAMSLLLATALLAAVLSSLR